MNTVLTKRQKLFYRLCVVAPNRSFFIKKTFSIAQLEKDLDGSKRSGYTRTFLRELVEMRILEFVNEEKIQGHWVKKYQINTKNLEDYLVNTEWYLQTRDLIDRIEPPTI